MSEIQPMNDNASKFDQMLRLAKVAERVANDQHAMLESINEQIKSILMLKGREHRVTRENALTALSGNVTNYLRDGGPPTNTDWTAIESELRE
jgi:hypothetical protein